MQIHPAAHSLRAPFFAGVLNIILKKSMEGGQLSLYYGRNGDVADGKNKDFSLSYGAGNDKAKLMFGLSHTEQGAVWARDREITRYSRGPNFPLENLIGGPWGRIRQVSASGGPIGFDRIINRTGGQDGVGVGADSHNPANYPNVTALTPVTADLFNATQQMVFAMPSKLDTIFTKGELQLPCASGFGGIAGTPAGFRQRTAAGAPITSSGGQQTPFPFNSGAGNAFLQPETAVTRTLGLVFSPSYVPGFSAALDWYSIQIDNRIVGVSATYILGECYTQGLPEFCSSIRRDAATGAVNQLSRGNANLGQIKTEGVDLELRYRLPRFAWGQVSLRSETTYLDEFSTKSSAAANWVDFSGEYDYHRWKSNFTADWALGNWSATWGMRYLSPVLDQCLNIPRGWSATNRRPAVPAPPRTVRTACRR